MFYVEETGTCYLEDVAIPCNPGRAKIPVTKFHGYKDGTIAYGGGSRKGACLPTIPHWTQKWALRDGLSATNVTTNLTSDTLVYTFGTGKETGLVIQVTDFNIAHDWESTVPVWDPQLASFNAMSIIMGFFKKNSLR